MTRTVNIVAAVQFEPAPLETRVNMARAEQLAFEAAAKGAQVVVLPELCLSGHRIMDRAEAASCAQARDGHQTECFLRVARRFGCHIVFGYVESCAGTLYSSAAIVGPGGLVGNAQKHNLAGTDHLWAARSEMPAPVVPTPAGRLGALVGRDVMNTWRSSRPFSPSGHLFYRPGSVDVLCLLAGREPAPSGLPDARWVDLAEETRSNVVVAALCGSAGTGGSCVVDRTLQVHTYGSSVDAEAVVGGMVLT